MTAMPSLHPSSSPPAAPAGTCSRREALAARAPGARRARRAGHRPARPGLRQSALPAVGRSTASAPASLGSGIAGPASGGVCRLGARRCSRPGRLLAPHRARRRRRLRRLRLGADHAGGAACAGVPTVLHEQNAVLGRANRLLAARRRADRDLVRPTSAVMPTATAEPAGHRQSGARRRSPPLRDQPYRAPADGRVVARWCSAAARARASSARSCRRRSLLAAAGAARAASRSPSSAGPRTSTRCAAPTREAGIDAELAPFFADVPERLAAAHLVIGRSGASTVAELAAVGRPVDPGALSLRRRRPPDRQRPRRCRGRRRLVVMPQADVHRRDAGRPSARRCSATPQRLAAMAAAAPRRGPRADAAAPARRPGRRADRRHCSPAGAAA